MTATLIVPAAGEMEVKHQGVDSQSPAGGIHRNIIT